MGLEYDLSQDRVMHLDLTKFTIVKSGTTVRETIEAMRRRNYNRALITEANGKLAGIFTDRDILNRVVTAPQTWDGPIDAVMTPNPVTVNAKDPAKTAMSIMNQHRFRNIPVLDDKQRVVGNLTHYSLIKHFADHLAASVYNLPPEPDRIARRRTGG